MAEIKDTYRTPEKPVRLVDDTYISLHEGAANLRPLEHVRLAREAMSHATSSLGEGPLTSVPEHEVEPTLSPLEQITRAARTVIAARKEQIDSTIELHDEDTTPSRSFVKKTFTLLTGIEKPKLFVKPTNERSLLQAESKVGSQIFPEVSAYSQREFFCLDESTWIWYEAQQDTETGKQVATTTRYEIHPNGILKAQEGSQYTYIEGEELDHLAMAAQEYADRVLSEVYTPLKAVA